MQIFPAMRLAVLPHQPQPTAPGQVAVQQAVQVIQAMPQQVQTATLVQVPAVRQSIQQRETPQRLMAPLLMQMAMS